VWGSSNQQCAESIRDDWGCLDSLMTTSDTHRFICTHPSLSPFFTNQASAAKSEFKTVQDRSGQDSRLCGVGYQSYRKADVRGNCCQRRRGKKP
jgi:hypothetical protein